MPERLAPRRLADLVTDRGLTKPPAGLYVTATPIGNAGDVTLRALELLATADLVVCEDTRVTAKLGAIYGLDLALFPYNDHNAPKMRPIILGRLREGATVALVSDAGTPLVSDPGFRLVAEARAEGIPVTVVPGASAVLAALVLSGLPSDRFLFAGFLPPRQEARRGELASLAGTEATLVFFESGPRLGAMLADAAAVLGDRPAAVCRELTKRFEEVVAKPLAALAAHFEDAGPPKGEIVVCVGGRTRAAQAADAEAAPIDALLETALRRASLREAVDAVTLVTGAKRKAVYARALALKGEEGEEGGGGDAG